MGLTGLRKIQIGEESTKGNAVAATAALLGKLSVEDKFTQHSPEEDRGSLIKPYRSIKTGDEVGLSFEGDCTFEQLIYFLHMGVLGNVTPSASGSENTWTFTPAKTAAGTFDSFTIEYGDDVQAFETEYCMASKISLSGGMNAPVTLKVDMFGRQIATTTFTGSITPPTVETALGQKSKLYIDNEDGTVGTTEKSSTLISWTYDIETGLYVNRYGDGNLYFSAYGENGAKATLEATVAFNSGVNTERANCDGATQRLMRVEITGTTIDANPREIDLDICGVYVPGSFKLLEERDGEDVVSFTLESRDSANYGKGFEVTVVNDVASLP
jgi:hypothetical protein